jgi:hypothetical protein
MNRGQTSKSGSDIPEWAKEERVKRETKVQNLLGIQGKIEVIEGAPEKKYQEREEMIEEAKKWSLS